MRHGLTSVGSLHLPQVHSRHQQLKLMVAPFFFFVDIVFFIYLYQCWIYRVDPKRVNTFGTSGEDHSNPPQLQGAPPGEGGTPGRGEIQAPPSEEGVDTETIDKVQDSTVKTDQEKKDD